MREEYSTKQRSLILEFIKESGSHITVSDIVDGLKAQGHCVGVATVYRALDRLVSTGEIRKFVIDEKSGACYQYAHDTECNRHFHLKCIKCGRLIHLSCDFLSQMEGHILKDHGFTVSPGKTVIYGICSDCGNAKCGENADLPCHGHKCEK